MKKSFFQLRPSYVIKTASYTVYAILLICTVSAAMPAMGYRSALPDLILCATVALAYFEGERVSAVFGMLAGFALESVGSTGFSILPLFYMLSGCVCALLFLKILGKNFGAYMIYVSLLALVRCAISLIYIQFSTPDYSIDLALGRVLLPEYAATVISAPVIFGLTYLISKRHNSKKSIQEERV